MLWQVEELKRCALESFHEANTAALLKQGTQCAHNQCREGTKTHESATHKFQLASEPNRTACSICQACRVALMTPVTR